MGNMLTVPMSFWILIAFGLFLVFIVAPIMTWVEEKRHFKRMSFLRTMVVVQCWILLASIEATRLAFLKYILWQDVREQAHKSCGAIARWLVSTFFDGFEVQRDSSGKHQGKAAKDMEKPVVIVANHQSMMDVAAIFTLGLRAAWVAKTTVFYIPGVGALMSMAGYVAVERKSKTSIKRMYAQCKGCVANGWSLIIFPQGTRNRHIALPFKNGAFNIAAELQLDVLPVSIHIRDDIWEKGSKLKVILHDEISGCHEDKEKVKKESFDKIMRCLEVEKMQNGCGKRGLRGDSGDGSTTSSSSSKSSNTNNGVVQQLKQRRGRGTALIYKASGVALSE